jgi:hypothetical protein
MTGSGETFSDWLANRGKARARMVQGIARDEPEEWSRCLECGCDKPSHGGRMKPHKRYNAAAQAMEHCPGTNHRGLPVPELPEQESA